VGLKYSDIGLRDRLSRVRFSMMRNLIRTIVALSLLCGTILAAGAGQPEGTWKLRSQRTISGTPPSFSPGLVMSVDSTGKLVRLNAPVPASIVGHDRMKFTVSADGRVLTQETKGLDDKTGRPYRYLLTWDKQ
jgi:hypothetical protein